MQFVLHRKLPFVKVYKTKIIKVYDVEQMSFQNYASDVFKNLDIAIVDVSIVKNHNDMMDYSFCVEVPKHISEETLVNLFKHIIKIEFSS